jgi:acetyl esterase
MAATSLAPTSTLKGRVEAAIARRLLRLPPHVVAWLLGKRRRVINGVALDPNVQLSLDLFKLTGRPTLDKLPPDRARAEFAKLVPIADLDPRDLHAVHDQAIAGPGGEMAIRIYRAKPGVLPAMVYVHGGGFVVGNLDTHDPPLRELAHQSGCAVIAVDYRLAPEHPFPAALDDALAALQWVQANAEALEIDPQRIAMGGDSAGGNLTAAVCHVLQKRGEPLPAAQVLIYPAVDMHNLAPSRHTYAKGFFLERELIAMFVQAYVPSPEMTADPRISPLLADDFTGHPPALLLTAGFDPLQDEGIAYGHKLLAAGGAVEFVHFPAQIHGVFGMAGAVADGRRAIAACADFLRRTLDA